MTAKNRSAKDFLPFSQLSLVDEDEPTVVASVGAFRWERPN